ncbi:MAG: hypothetical protein M3Z31_05460 [Pseudomonadota bacterium]|nr:hypothetical protein [Pseudomonadota bacterium]
MAQPFARHAQKFFIQPSERFVVSWRYGKTPDGHTVHLRRTMGVMVCPPIIEKGTATGCQYLDMVSSRSKPHRQLPSVLFRASAQISAEPRCHHRNP